MLCSLLLTLFNSWRVLDTLSCGRSRTGYGFCGGLVDFLGLQDAVKESLFKDSRLV